MLHRMTLNCLSVVIILACAGIASVYGQEVGTEFRPQGCSQLYRELYGERLRVTVNGTRMIFHALSPETGHYDERASLQFQWTNVLELQVRQSPGSGCGASTNLIIQQQMLNECQCYPEPIENHVGEFVETGWRIILKDCPSDPNFVASAFVSTLNTSVEQFFNNTMPGSSSDSFIYSNPAGGAKFGFGLQNWGWSNASQFAKSAYLATGFEFGFYSDYPFEVGQYTTKTSFFLNAKMGIYRFLFNLDLGFLLEGTPAINSRPDVFFPISNEGGTGGETIVYPINVAYCQPPYPPGTSMFDADLVKWNNIYYDPSLTVLFDTVPIDSPVSGPSKGKPWVIAVAVAIPIVFILVVGVVLAFKFSPAFQRIVQPFSKSKPTHHKNTEDSIAPRATVVPLEPTSGWKQSAKPTT